MTSTNYKVISVARVESKSVIGTLEALEIEVDKYLAKHADWYPCGSPILISDRDNTGFWGWSQVVVRK